MIECTKPICKSQGCMFPQNCPEDKPSAPVEGSRVETFSGRPPLPAWSFNIDRPCYICQCGQCRRFFLAISKHLPVCRDCNGNPEYIWANPTQSTSDFRRFFQSENSDSTTNG